MDAPDEIKRLQGCVNDLIGVLALPAIWSGAGQPEILSTLVGRRDVRAVRPQRLHE